MTTARPFRGFRFPAEVILWAVRWYLRFGISNRDLERMLADRGIAVDHTTLYRWTQRFAPELEQRLRRHLRPCHGPWHVDATYVRVDGEWRYLYRAVDGTGQTIDVRLSAKRDGKAARRFIPVTAGSAATASNGSAPVGSAYGLRPGMVWQVAQILSASWRPAAGSSGRSWAPWARAAMGPAVSGAAMSAG